MMISASWHATCSRCSYYPVWKASTQLPQLHVVIIILIVMIIIITGIIVIIVMIIIIVSCLKGKHPTNPVVLIPIIIIQLTQFNILS